MLFVFVFVLLVEQNNEFLYLRNQIYLPKQETPNWALINLLIPIIQLP